MYEPSVKEDGVHLSRDSLQLVISGAQLSWERAQLIGNVVQLRGIAHHAPVTSSRVRNLPKLSAFKYIGFYNFCAFVWFEYRYQLLYMHDIALSTRVCLKFISNSFFKAVLSCTFLIGTTIFVSYICGAIFLCDQSHV